MSPESLVNLISFAANDDRSPKARSVTFDERIDVYALEQSADNPDDRFIGAKRGVGRNNNGQ